MIRVLVVDDHPIVRAGITGLLETETDFTVVGEAESGEVAVALATLLAPDVVLMDLRMPGIGGVEATRRITANIADPANIAVGHPPSSSASKTLPHVLVFTTYEDDDQILAAIEAGASGYLLKAGPADQLTAGIRAVASGQTVLAPNVAAQLARAATRPLRIDPPSLTPRESEILALVARGLSNPEIAEHLVIGESTVKTHLLHLFAKLKVNGRTRAVTRAQELGLLN